MVSDETPMEVLDMLLCPWDEQEQEQGQSLVRSVASQDSLGGVSLSVLLSREDRVESRQGVTPRVLAPPRSRLP